MSFSIVFVPRPLCGAREAILRGLTERGVVVVAGETGCGKSTQVPQPGVLSCHYPGKMASSVRLAVPLDSPFYLPDSFLLFCPLRVFVLILHTREAGLPRRHEEWVHLTLTPETTSHPSEATSVTETV